MPDAAPLSPDDPLAVDDLPHLITLLTTESNLIWSRYSAMLTACTVIIAVVALAGSSPAMSGDTPYLLIGGGILGAVLSVAWFVLTRVGWRTSKKLATAIRTVRSPLMGFYGGHDESDSYEKLALLVVLVFLAMYVVGACYGFSKLR